MKNYLGNLIARHMSQADVLLPRHASRFEPQSSVLQTDGVQVETTEMDVAESFGVESDVVAPVSEAISVVPNQVSVVPDPIPVVSDPVSVGPASDPVFEAPAAEPVVDVSVPDFVAPVSPVPSGIERRVANPSPPTSRSPESVVESSGPDVAMARTALTNPTLVVTDDFESSVPSKTIAVASDREDEASVSQATSDRVSSVSRVPSVDRVASTRPVHRDDDSESRGVVSTDFTTPSRGEVATDPGWTKTTDQVAVVDHVADRTPKESGPTIQPFTANEPVTTDKPLIANELLTAIEPLIANEPLTAIEPLIANEHVTEIERVTPPLRAALTNPNQALTQRPIETQRAVAKPTTETERETLVPAANGEPFAPATKSEPLALAAKSEPFASSVSHLAVESSTGPSKPQPSNVEPANAQPPSSTTTIEHSAHELSTAIVPEPIKEVSALVNAVPETPVSPKQPESLPEEARATQVAQRARPLETSVARPRVSESGSPVNGPGNTRLMPRNDITPTDTGPTINVTIGRIEVRAAATSEARPQKQRREQQVLSLDDYLNQRSAGGR